MKVTATIKNDKWLRKIDNLLKAIDKPILKELPKYTEWFVQSVVKKTPPKSGAKKKRPVILLKTNRFTKRGTEKKRYRVPYRTARKKGAKYFDKKKDANKFAKIIYRYIGKAGWLFSGEKAINKKMNVKLPRVQPEVMSMRNQLAKGKRKRLRLKPIIEIINTVLGIGRYARVATALALQTTNRRIKGWQNKKKIKGQYSKIWEGK